MKSGCKCDLFGVNLSKHIRCSMVRSAGLVTYGDFAHRPGILAATSNLVQLECNSFRMFPFHNLPKINLVSLVPAPTTRGSAPSPRKQFLSDLQAEGPVHQLPLSWFAFCWLKPDVFVGWNRLMILSEDSPWDFTGNLGFQIVKQTHVQWIIVIPHVDVAGFAAI